MNTLYQSGSVFLVCQFLYGAFCKRFFPLRDSSTKALEKKREKIFLLSSLCVWSFGEFRACYTFEEQFLLSHDVVIGERR